MLPLEKTVLTYPLRFHTGLSHPFVEGRPGESAVLLNLPNGVAVDGGGICHGWEVCGRLKMSAEGSEFGPKPTPKFLPTVRKPLRIELTPFRGVDPTSPPPSGPVPLRGFQHGPNKRPNKTSSRTTSNAEGNQNSTDNSTESRYRSRVGAQPRPDCRNRIRDRKANHLEKVSGHLWASAPRLRGRKGPIPNPSPPTMSTATSIPPFVSAATSAPPSRQK